MKKDILSESEIRKSLKKNKNRIIAIYEETESTNLLAKKRFKEDGAIVLADRQSAGRGRMGRSFFSPRGSGLYMSVSLRPNIPAEKTVFITVAAAVAVSRAIDRLYGINTQIKWVNDIYYKGKKVCGILTEAMFENDNAPHIVVGIGVNVSAPEGGFPEDIKDKASALPDNDNVTRNMLVAEIVNELDEILLELKEKTFLNEYREKSCLTGKKVKVIPVHKEEFEAEVLEIDDNAHLVIVKDNGEKINLFTGKVSIKMQNN
jgi:BirA family biotin operon repressor/biotin-[acetyl-CoA-carboxylase] ligase